MRRPSAKIRSVSLELVTVGRVSVDLYAREQDASYSQVETFAKSIGGSPTNVAVAAARLGRRAAVITAVGDDPFGEYVREALADRFGVDVRFVGTHPTLRTPLAFAAMDPPEDPQLLFYREPAAPDMQIRLDRHRPPGRARRRDPLDQRIGALGRSPRAAPRSRSWATAIARRPSSTSTTARCSGATRPRRAP